MDQHENRRVSDTEKIKKHLLNQMENYRLKLSKSPSRMMINGGQFRTANFIRSSHHLNATASKSSPVFKKMISIESASSFLSEREAWDQSHELHIKAVANSNQLRDHPNRASLTKANTLLLLKRKYMSQSAAVSKHRPAHSRTQAPRTASHHRRLTAYLEMDDQEPAPAVDPNIHTRFYQYSPRNRRYINDLNRRTKEFIASLDKFQLNDPELVQAKSVQPAKKQLVKQAASLDEKHRTTRPLPVKIHPLLSRRRAKSARSLRDKYFISDDFMNSVQLSTELGEVLIRPPATAERPKTTTTISRQLVA